MLTPENYTYYALLLLAVLRERSVGNPNAPVASLEERVRMDPPQFLLLMCIIDIACKLSIFLARCASFAVICECALPGLPVSIAPGAKPSNALLPPLERTPPRLTRRAYVT